jgi:DNA-binding beta-propeller fold protein YncE
MLQRVQKLPQPARIALFVGIALAILALLVLATLAVGVAIVQNTPRLEAVALVEGYQVAEYMVLPDEDAYPATVAVDAAGTVYTGSYVSGAVWALDTRQTLREIADSRRLIGSVTAISAAPDGSLYILDRISPLEVLGARVWRLASDDSLTLLRDFTGQDADILQLPDDIAIDAQGSIYITDRGIDQNHDVIYRIAADGTEGVWWQSPPVMNQRAYAPTGLGYSPEKNALYVTDSILDLVYEVPIGTDGQAGETRVVYDRRFGSEAAHPGFDGVSVAPDGRLFLSGLGNNRVGVYDPNTGLLTYLAGNFRGAADVVYDPLTQRLFVANWDQRSLLPTPVLFISVQTRPHLPFAIDVVTPG